MATQRTGTEPGAAQLMRGSLRLGIGVDLIVLRVALLAAILWAWSFASTLISANSGITVAIYLFGVKFSPSAGFSPLLIVLLTAMLGSVAVPMLTFLREQAQDSQEWLHAVPHRGQSVRSRSACWCTWRSRPALQRSHDQRSASARYCRGNWGTGRSLHRPGPKEDAEHPRTSPDQQDSIRQGRR